MPNPKTTSPAGLTLLKQFEGLRLYAYQDIAGVWTIGYGSTAGVKAGMVLKNEAEAEALLRRDLEWVEKGVAKYAKVPLKQHQFDALVCLAYNIGLGAFKKSTALRHLNDGDYSAAADAMLRFSKARVNGELVVVAGLLRRRKAERELFNGKA